MASSRKRRKPRTADKSFAQLHPVAAGEAPLGKILCVDSQREICDVVGEYLSGEGYVVMTVGRARAARELIKEDKFDLIITELMIPEEDGLTMIRTLRNDDVDTPIICLTSRGEIVDRIIGLEMGANDYIAKPFHLRELLARVNAVLRNRTPTTSTQTSYRANHYLQARTLPSRAANTFVLWPRHRTKIS